MVFDRRPRVEYDPHADRRQAWEGFSLADRLTRVAEIGLRGVGADVIA